MKKRKSRFYIKVEAQPEVREFSRGEKQVLHVCVKSNDNEDKA
ncbi:MAG: hypothetical protein AAF630_15655 [Cyanobacteria bacterium P01_C01_bin.38]